MPSKKPSQTEPLLDAPAETGTKVAEQESSPKLGLMGQRIMDQLRALDPEPFREVLRDILLSFKGTRWKGLDADKRVKAAKDLAMLTGFAQPSLVINNNHLHVERMNDAQLMAELGKARAQLAAVMNGDAHVIGTDLASLSPEGTGGLGAPGSSRVYAQGPSPAGRNPEIEDANVIEPARPSDHAARGEQGPVTAPAGEARPEPGSMAEKIAQLREAGKVTIVPPVVRNSKAPAAGAARPQGRKGKK